MKNGDRPARLRVLIVDDDPVSLKLLEKALEVAGYDVVTAESGEDGRDRMKDETFHAAVVDIRLPGMSGIELLREIKHHDPLIEVVLTTARPDVSTAVAALKEGADDYLQKPLNLAELRHRMNRVMERRFLRGEVTALRNRLGEQLAVKQLRGVSSAIERLRETAAKVAQTNSSVLIEGESGTGKELLAAAIHRLSRRSRAPFIPVNCGAIPENLLESEFFGHVRGAFSGAVSDTLGLFRSADQGTLFLDEVAELPLALQSKFLRVLQEQEVRPVGSSKAYRVDVRIIAATNQNLDAAVEAGTFRADLFYRLNVVRTAIPPLRERPQDIPVLVRHFIRQFNERFGRAVQEATPDAVDLLQAYPFPGNVRELENLIERAYALGATRELSAVDFPALSAATVTPAQVVATIGHGERGERADRDASGRVGTGVSPDRLPTIDEVERELIVRALRRYPSDKDGAARAIGLSPRTMYRRIKAYGLRSA
jgi:DNA-binding NtrC family response regulator